MLLIPIRTDCPPRRRPTLNSVLIGINVAAFVAMNYLFPSYRDQIMSRFQLNCSAPKSYEFITYAFLHADFWHLLGNMVFLYIFGNSLNDKLGHLEYLLFYLAGAIVSGAAYCLFTWHPMVGASGAIAAVTTGFLVLFPLSRVLVLYVLFFIGTFEMSSLVLIGIKMILWDNIVAPSFGNAGNVAHGAHLAGYLFGFVTPFAFLALRILPRDQFDIISLWSRAYRRKQFRRAVRTNPQTMGVGYRYARPVRAKVRSRAETAVDLASDQISQLRSEIDRALERYDLTTAAERYLDLLKLDADHVLVRRQQLDVANQLMAEKRFNQAAEAYEKYLKHYSAGEQVTQVKLLLGIIYSRHVSNEARARELLENALGHLSDPSQQDLCRTELDRLKASI